MSADVSVVVRVKSSTERNMNCAIGSDEQTVTIQEKTLRFDKVFTPDKSQADVFNQLGGPLIDNVLNGYNCCLMAYGATGSGKTYTMMGDDAQKGLIPRIMERLFERLADNKGTRTTVQCNYVEIYTEKIRDLLHAQKKAKSLKLRELTFQPSDKALPPQTYTYIEGCKTCSVASVNDVLRVIAYGTKNRVTAATDLNAHSSRSHSVFIVSILQIDLESQVRTTSRLFMVDLAGSELVERSGVQGQQFVEACHINKSLSTLSLVINAVVEQMPHVPYRNSKLTCLLRDSFGGNSKTILVLTIDPHTDEQLAESIRTLQFGKRASSMRNKAVANVEVSIDTYKEIIRQLEQKIELLQRTLDQTDTSKTYPLHLTDDVIVHTLSARAPADAPTPEHASITDIDDGEMTAQVVTPMSQVVTPMSQVSTPSPMQSVELLFSTDDIMVVGPGLFKFTEY